MGNEVTPMEGLNTFLLGREDKFLTLNETVRPLNFAAEVDFARQAIMKNDYLFNAAKGNQMSLADAITNVAAIGISLNPANKHAYLVPRKVNDVLSVCLDISYTGMIKLATDTGVVKYMKAELVYENDDFTYHGFDRRPEIAVKNPFDTSSRGALLGCIAWAKLSSGDYLNEFMTLDDIDKIRNDSQGYASAAKKGGWHLSNNVWVKHEGEMQKKTVIKRLYKTLPVSDGSDVMSHAISVLNEHEGIEFDKQDSKPIELHYTDNQYQAYKSALDNGDYVGLLCVRDSVINEGQAQLFTALELPRIEKGGKGKWDKAMAENLKAARELREGNTTTLIELIDNGDDSAVIEIAQEANEWEVGFYLQALPSEQAGALAEILKSNETEIAA